MSEDPVLLQLQRTLASVYKVERQLGRGEIAAVYQAVEIAPNRPVALKVLPPGLGQGPAAARFKREARMAAALNHPNILPIYRVGLIAGAYFFAMKLVEGRSLDVAIESQGALPLSAILVVLRATTAALAYAHERGAIHGDIKGANILVDRDGRVMVSDFGIARAVEDETHPAAGKPHFLNPEQAGRRPLVPQSDQYSLGLVAFQMITGSVAVDADSLTPAFDVRSARDGLPGGLVQVVQTALAKDPAQRYASTADMLAAIEAIPFSDAERREAYAVLGQLARGEPVPKVRAPSPPPRSDEKTVSRAAAPRAVSTPAPATKAAPAVPAPAPLAVKIPAPVAPGAPPAPPPPVVLAVPSAWEQVAPTKRAMLAVPGEPAPHRRSRVAWLIAAVLIIAGLAGAGYWLLGRRPAAIPIAQAPTGIQAAAPAQPAAAAAVPAAAESARSDTAHLVRAATDSARSDTSQATGLLLLNAVPSSADILVDGKPAGAGGFVDIEVRAGRRHLKISAPGYATLDTVVTVRADVTVNLGQVSLAGGPPAVEAAPTPAPQAPGRLRLRTVPVTAEIFVDGQAVGVGGLVDFEVTAGPRQLRISAPGYVTLDTLITVDAGATVRLGQVSLKSSGGGP